MKLALETKSLARLRRYAKKLAVRGEVIFEPASVSEEWRYAVHTGVIAKPLGKNAQTARHTLTTLSHD